MDAGTGIGTILTVQVTPYIAPLTIWDYLLFFGTLALIGFVGFFGIKFTYNKFHNKNGFLGMKIDKL